MARYELNDLGKDWVFTGDSEEEVTKRYIKSVCGARSIKAYEKYCKKVDCDPSLNWYEVPPGCLID